MRIETTEMLRQSDGMLVACFDGMELSIGKVCPKSQCSSISTLSFEGSCTVLIEWSLFILERLGSFLAGG